MTTRRKRLESEQRREALLSAAHRSFLESGYAGTSLDTIISAVGGSRRNIYREFGGKSGLLHAVIERIIATIADDADARRAETCRSIAPGSDDPRDWLVGVGVHFVRQMTRPDVVAVFRQLIALGSADESADRLWAAGPERFRAGLEAWLREQHDAGRLSVEDPAFVAAQLPELMRGSLQLDMLVGRRETVSDAAVRRQVERAIDLVMPALTPRGRHCASAHAR